MTKLDHATLDLESRFLNISKNSSSSKPFNFFEEDLVDMIFEKHLKNNVNDSIDKPKKQLK